MQTVVKVVVGLPMAQGKVPALIYNIIREERILHNDAQPWPGEIYLQLEASEALLKMMDGQMEAYFHGEAGEGELHITKDGNGQWHRATRQEYEAGARDKKLFVIH
jgi:hypothetical protein